MRYLNQPPTDLLHDGVDDLCVEQCEGEEEDAGEPTEHSNAHCSPHQVHTNETEGSHLSSASSLCQRSMCQHQLRHNKTLCGLSHHH